MSGIVDMWTSELEKMRARGETIVGSSGSSQGVPVKEEWGFEKWRRILKEVKIPAVLSTTCSDASISMLVQWFSA